MEKVSIALATYNGARFVRQQLDSIAAQTLQPSELVVCDDQSTDGTVSIIEEFRKRAGFPARIQVNLARLGPADNFNKAVSLCSFPITAFCDQDDVWLPEKLAVSVRRLVEDGSLLSLHRATVTDEMLRPIGCLDQGIAADGVLEPLQPLSYTDAGWGMSMTFRSMLARLNPAERRPVSPVTGAIMGHDTWIYVLATALGRVSLIRSPLILYRQHGSNAYGATRKAKLFDRLAGFVTVPLDRYRYRALFFAQARRRFLGISTSGTGLSSQAGRAAEAFGLRAGHEGLRISLYCSPTFPARARSWFACHGRGCMDYRSALKDILLGVFRMGRIRESEPGRVKGIDDG